MLLEKFKCLTFVIIVGTDFLEITQEKVSLVLFQGNQSDGALLCQHLFRIVKFLISL